MYPKCFKCSADKVKINDKWYCRKRGEYIEHIYFRDGVCPQYDELPAKARKRR